MLCISQCLYNPSVRIYFGEIDDPKRLSSRGVLYWLRSVQNNYTVVFFCVTDRVIFVFQRNWSWQSDAVNREQRCSYKWESYISTKRIWSNSCQCITRCTTLAYKHVDTKRVVNCGLRTRFDAISSMEIFKVINKPQQLHTNYTTRS